MQKNISTLVGLKNNLEYSQHFYETFRQIYPTEELVFVSYGSTDGTYDWLHSMLGKDENLRLYVDIEPKTFSDTYNKAIEIATKDFVVFAHNDMVVAPNFLENLEKYAHKDRVISYTTVEPPIFTDHERPGKVIRDFGSDLVGFNQKTFNLFSISERQIMENKTGEGISFFMCLSRQVLLDIGGFDNIFNPYFSEDDDLIKRLKLKGLKCFTSLDSIVYHFVSKTSRFSEEAKTKTHQIERNSNRTFLRKWGSINSNNRFNVGFVVENCTEQLLEVLEPWCDSLYSNIDPTHYIYKEQPTTSFNLNERILHGYEEDNDIIIRFDGSKLNQNNFEIIRNLQNMLEGIEPGIYEVDIFTINVVTPTNLIKNLIFIQK
jgi:GT2 family glycosyltransferase